MTRLEQLKDDLAVKKHEMLALLVLDEQADGEGALAGEMHEAARVIKRLLRQGRPAVDRDDLPSLRSNFGTINGGV